MTEVRCGDKLGRPAALTARTKALEFLGHDAISYIGFSRCCKQLFIVDAIGHYCCKFIDTSTDMQAIKSASLAGGQFASRRKNSQL